MGALNQFRARTHCVRPDSIVQRHCKATIFFCSFKKKVRARRRECVFSEKHHINVHTHTYMSTHPCEHMYAYPIPMSTSKRLNRLDLKIHEVDHQERLTVDGDVASH
jgi:hypothetical protein